MLTKQLKALKLARDMIIEMLEKDDPAASTQMEWPQEQLDQIDAAIAEVRKSKKRELRLAEHVVAMADDAYLVGHPEWVVIAEQAKKIVARTDIVSAKE